MRFLIPGDGVGGKELSKMQQELCVFNREVLSDSRSGHYITHSAINHPHQSINSTEITSKADTSEMTLIQRSGAPQLPDDQSDPLL